MATPTTEALEAVVSQFLDLRVELDSRGDDAPFSSEEILAKLDRAFG